MKIPPFTEKLWILLIPYLSFILAGATKYFSPKRRAEEMKALSHFRFFFGQMSWKVRIHGARISRSFSWFAKVCQVLYVYFVFTPSPNFDFVENGRMFRPYKQKEKVECWPLALLSKRHVVLQTMARKCIKACSISATQLSHLACTNTITHQWLHIPELNCSTSQI